MHFKWWCELNPLKQLHEYICSFTSCDLTAASSVCVLQKHVAVLFVPGALGVSGISVSAHSVQARPSRQCVALTASPTTTSANSACRPACIRRELTWRRPAAVMKVRKGVWDAVIFFLSSWPLKWCNYLHQLTCRTAFSHSGEISNDCICCRQETDRQPQQENMN